MTSLRKRKASATLRIGFQSKRQMDAVASALKPELIHPAGERARAVIIARGKWLKLLFAATDSSALRAIMNSYLRLLSASLNTLIQVERPPSARQSDKS